MELKKIVLIVLLGFFIFSFASNVSAYQKKMAIEECLMSYNDENYGPWDEANHQGVFVKVINHNPTLGESENANYEYINYQTNNPVNSMPILNIEPGKPNMLYTNCTQKVGDYRIYLQNYIVPYQGDGNGLHLSPDFNFNDGITVEGGFSNANSPAYNGAESTFQHYQYNLKLSPHGTVYYADNEVNSGYDADATAIYQEGFFPNTRPVMMTKINLTDYASGVLYGYSLIRETGYVGLIDIFWNKFYLNSSTKNIEDFLAAKVVAGGSMTNLDNPNKGGASTTNTLACSEAANDCFDLSKGGKLEVTYKFRNIFSIPLSGLEVRSVWTTSASRKSFGLSRTEVSRYPSQIIYETIADIPAFTTVDYIIENDIEEDNNYIWAGTHGYIMFKNIFGDYAQAQYFRPGDDSESLLGFRNFDPRIEMQEVAEGYEPVFNMTVSLTTENTRFNYEEVFPGDYDLVYEVWNGTAVKDSYNVAGGDVFSQIGVASMPQGAIHEFNYLLPIKEEYAAESAGGAQYDLHVYVVARNGGKFDGLKIATPTKVPYFTPGDITYQLDNRLRFGNDSRMDSKKIVIFNPTFYENDIDLSIKSWSDDENFSLSWDGVNFGQNSKTIHLFPLQSREITFWVNSTYDPWVNSHVSKNLIINLSSNLNTGSKTVSKTQDINYILEVSPNNLNWSNLNPLGISPVYIKLDNLNSVKNQDILLDWQLEGSGDRLTELDGEDYKVTVRLINGTDESTGNILKELNKTFTVGNEETEMILNYDFRYGEYLIRIDLDSANQIDEKLSSGISGENDNIGFYVLPILVTYCEYNEDDGYMHRIDFWGNDVIDKENKCECPREFLTIRDVGYCADPNGDCSIFSTYGICNNWSKTDGFACGWKCNGPFCPPKDVDNGDCLNCSSIPNMCSGYNNEVTCNLDPCQKARIYDCAALNCNVNEVNGCVWDSDNTCKFEGIFANGNTCKYYGDVVKECDGISKEGLVNFTSTDLGCPPKQRAIACPQDLVGLSFFTMFNFISAIVLITLFYCGRQFIKK